MIGIEHYLAAEDHLESALATKHQGAITNHLAAAGVHALLALVQSQATGEAAAQFLRVAEVVADDPWQFTDPRALDADDQDDDEWQDDDDTAPPDEETSTDA